MKQKIKTGIILTSVAVATLHVINRCVNAAAIVKNLLSNNGGHFFEWRFGKVFYTKTGSGSPILLIHDLSPYASSFEWKDMVVKLAKDHTVYCVDLLGCGRSDKPNLTYTNYFYVQLINDFIEQVIGEKTDVAVTGFSSSFVVMACNSNPELFDKIIMVNPERISSLKSVPRKNSKVIKFIMDLPIIGTAIYNMFVSRDNLEYLFMEKYFYNPFLVSKKMLHVYYEAAHLGESGGKYLLSSLHGFYVNVNLEKALSEINNSIVILEGNKVASGKEIVDNYLKINASIEADYLENVKLYPQLENPEQLYEHMRVYL